MHREDGKRADDVYENIDVLAGTFGKEIKDRNAMRIQSSELTGSVGVKIRSSRAAPVCLVLLCVLLLTAVIVLGVMFTQERLINNSNFTEERIQLQTKIINLIQLNVQLNQEKNELTKLFQEGWTYYQSSFYYISNDTKNWTESRRYCTKRGADLVSINNREEQDFVKNMSGAAVVYIGLTDSDVENTWKWVDGSNMTSGFWAPREPNGDTRENCVVTVAVPKLPEWPGLVRVD
ncbi:C-type lectin domain family 4 member K-like isoform X2 [Megalobrama amblycephala]|uniref:C-type lectin domain family 4 member K-like isoform X2 n=1 Tax=Megalobrama amblycephala TaxID=75352 RepID=UPI0020141C9D|nr:C-type lectin domain family 4 member K-like isoform X2 [Megalobrama amblycephala]